MSTRCVMCGADPRYADSRGVHMSHCPVTLGYWPDARAYNASAGVERVPPGAAVFWQRCPRCGETGLCTWRDIESKRAKRQTHCDGKRMQLVAQPKGGSALEGSVNLDREAVAHISRALRRQARTNPWSVA